LCDIAQAILWDWLPTTENVNLVQAIQNNSYSFNTNYNCFINVTALDSRELPGLPGWSWRCGGSQVRSDL